MQKPAIPPNENERLAALRELLILDTPPEERFDRIVKFAAAEFGVPIALISLVDENRQWFKAKVGIDACETSRDVSFCGHALHDDKPLIVPDALHDKRFCYNPLVVNAPYIRFYIGAPLVLPSGLIAGTLCLIDAEPHTVDETDIAILETLRDLAVIELITKEAT